MVKVNKIVHINISSILLCMPFRSLSRGLNVGRRSITLSEQEMVALLSHRTVITSAVM